MWSLKLWFLILEVKTRYQTRLHWFGSICVLFGRFFPSSPSLVSFLFQHSFAQNETKKKINWEDKNIMKKKQTDSLIQVNSDSPQFDSCHTEWAQSVNKWLAVFSPIWIVNRILYVCLCECECVYCMYIWTCVYVGCCFFLVFEVFIIVGF